MHNLEVVGLTGDDANSTKYILDATKVHGKPRINEIVAEIAYKQLVQVDPGLPEYIKKYKEVTAVCNLSTAYDKYLWNAILLGLRNQWV